jgi:hypothetical protein
MSDRQTQQALEHFSRDLLFLIKSIRVYPSGHPSIESANERLAGWWLPDGREYVRLGITRTELTVDSHFYGGTRTRITALAGLLYNRKISSIQIEHDVPAMHYVFLAHILNSPTVEDGVPLVEAVEAYGITAIKLEALDVSRVHDGLSKVAKKTDEEGEELDARARGHQAWLWLQSESTRAEDVAYALSSKDLWSSSEQSDEEAFRLGYLLSGLGQRLDQGLNFLDPDQKSNVLSRLQSVGKRVTPEQLAKIVSQCPDNASLQREGMLALVGDMEGDKLLDLMAGVISVENPSADRFLELYKQFSPPEGYDFTLDMVRKRLKDGDHRGFAVDIWKSLESLLLNIFHDSFMDADYSSSLDDVAKGAIPIGGYDVGLDFAEDAAPYLDMVYLGLALSVGGHLEQPWDDLFNHLRQRLEDGDVHGVTALIDSLDELAPYAMQSQPGLVEQIVDTCCTRASMVDIRLRHWLRKFVKRNSEVLFEHLLNTLKETPRISLRRLQVELLSEMDFSTTPKLISKARSGEWFFARNLLIVLGRRGDFAAMPFIISMIDHPERRVQREALKTLANFDLSGREVLEAFALDNTRQVKERELALSIIERTWLR